MRRIPAFLALTLTACGPVRPPALPRYVVVTTIPENDPLHRVVDDLADFRVATILHATSLLADAPRLAERLRELQPDFVAAVVRPSEITPEQAGALIDVLCRLDDDPFPDAALGWFVATDPAFLSRQLQALRGAEAKVEKRLLQATVVRTGPAADRTDRLEWASGLPLRRLHAPAGDTSFLESRLGALQRCDYLVLGAPPLRGLRLDSAIVFSEVPGSGSPFRPHLADLLQAGAAAVFAPLGDERASEGEREFADAVATDRDLGEIWRRSAESAILSGRSPAARLLFGCPRLDAYSRPARLPLKEIAARHAGRELQATFQVVSWDNTAAFADPSGNERIHLRIPCPTGFRRIRIIDARGEAQGKPVPVTATAASLERRPGSDLAHVLLRAPRLAVEDLFLSVRLEID